MLLFRGEISINKEIQGEVNIKRNTSFQNYDRHCRLMKRVKELRHNRMNPELE